MTARRVSMADVAERAGVSGQTVSRVVNASPRVDPETRARIEAAMTELGYRPHRAARALRTGRTQTIGLVVSTLASVGNSRMLQAVADAAATRGYALTVVTLGADGDVAAAFERLAEQGVDGAIVLNEATARVRGADVGAAGLRLVVVDSPRDDRFGVVETDHAGGARHATEHLLALGHAIVRHLAGPDGSFAAAERERGWREALTAAGASVPPVVRGDWTSASGFAAASALLESGATAVFAANDQMALGVLRAVAESGRAVPGDVSVVGFDDVADAADYRPPLTTVRQDFDALGARAVAALVDGIEAGTPAAFETVPTRLVVRESTAPAPPPGR
ncbi:LacI family DNA-binding transcriptional regulator [Microbacterium sp. PRC9]|uniref:LacI family DNA-binding transcriptional regulator n=1 Tax=Microbacterium sp. PRC9 TaxID=2962591 RepID=UPI0028813926|nr:LacI family DNA-binding transcriptional regulator [Microbacterium sp. PRC9]MDT0143310.1 LacI family DNA-binding transcriptional regulator [Microbacterium sp. PRC9]